MKQRGWYSRRRNFKQTSWIRSTTRHVKSCRNTGGPPPKAKYYLVTDSEAVPWGKGEKNPARGVKKNLKPCVYKQRKSVKARPRTFCRTGQRVTLYSEVNVLSTGAVEKSSLNRAQVIWRRPETGWPIHEQVEVTVKGNGGPNPYLLKKVGMTCG